MGTLQTDSKKKKKERERETFKQSNVGQIICIIRSRSEEMLQRRTGGKKESSSTQEMQFPSLGQKDPLEKEMATD